MPISGGSTCSCQQTRQAYALRLPEWLSPWAYRWTCLNSRKQTNDGYRYNDSRPCHVVKGRLWVDERQSHRPKRSPQPREEKTKVHQAANASRSISSDAIDRLPSQTRSTDKGSRCIVYLLIFNLNRFDINLINFSFVVQSIRIRN